MLAKKKIGMKTIIEVNSTTFSTQNARIGEDPHVDQRLADPQLGQHEGDQQQHPGRPCRR